MLDPPNCAEDNLPKIPLMSKRFTAMVIRTMAAAMVNDITHFVNAIPDIHLIMVGFVVLCPHLDMVVAHGRAVIPGLA